MKTAFPSSVDHNQMLVVSVILHLLAILVVLFMPKPGVAPKKIIPAFDVEVLEIPAQRVGAPKRSAKAEVPKLQPVPEVKEAVEEKQAASQPLVKPVAPKAPAPKPPAPKPAEKKAKAPEKPAPVTSKIMEELERLEEKPKPPELLKELDQLAKLEAPAVPKKQEPVKPQKVEKVKPPAEEKEAKPKPLKKEDVSEAEFDNLAKKPLNIEKETKEKSASELASELKRQMQLESIKGQKIKPDTSAKQVDLSVTSNLTFDSALRKVEIHDSKKDLPEGLAASHMPHPKTLSDPLSLYAGAIEEKIYSNWKSPLGSKNNEVHVSFFLFPKGNIGKPFIEKSSGNEQLDALAIRAILDSEPFPGFPPELKEPSLHFTIHFKYIPQG